ncbi:hypothetical protein [Nostoc sp. MS1]|uniref:hypothetical protein n=1 Tax=Nostoc sp. MS1 TaxID=2764711 RepID=UPI001CC4CAE2|nr:hypothetical protein [Nostoc sp. MS1]BCL39443.1 hypothetical protein NSMS1_58900 [Nostoc sp. MS1]
MEIQELKALIKETMREVLQEEKLLLCQILIPYVSDEEQDELKAEFGVPSEYTDDEVVEMTAWGKKCQSCFAKKQLSFWKNKFV